MALARITTRPRSIWVRLIAGLCVIATGWHIFATFLWIGPSNGLRDAVPAKALSGYMLPLFGQSWSVFAPEPINGNVTLEVRAYVGDEGSGHVTDWVNASAAELDMAHHNLFPPRAAILGLEQGSKYKSAFDKLTDAEKKIVAAGYFVGDDWLDRLETGLKAAGPNNTAAQKKNLESFLSQEKQTVAYATEVAKAMWGSGAQRVQVRASRQNITPFKDRLNPDAKPQPIRVVDSGWRGTFSFPGQNSGHFSDIFSNLDGLK